MIDGVTGFLVASPAEAAERAIRLLEDPRLGARLGENGHQHVKQHFLITRHTRDYLQMVLALGHAGKDGAKLVA